MRTTKNVTLSCEGLEGRECPAVQAFLVGGTLTVVGDSLANQITVTDNGTTVSVLDNGTELGNSPFSGVTGVVVRGGGGDDTIDYTTSAASLITSVKLQGGLGNDTINLHATSLDTASAAPTTTQFVIAGGQGSDAIAPDLGGVAAGDTVSLFISGGTGPDSVTLSAAGIVAGTMDVQVIGDQGKDTLSLSATLLPGSTGKATLNANGAQGIDTVTTTTNGEVDGTLTILARGGPGDDKLITSPAITPDSTGTLNVTTGGGQGIDNMELHLTAQEIDSTINVLTLGGLGPDTIFSETKLTSPAPGETSSGTLTNKVDSGPGRDTLTSIVTVDNVAATPTTLDALFGGTTGHWLFELNGNLGFDTGTFTDGVVTPISIEVQNP